jgi:hypothetical protein
MQTFDGVDYQPELDFVRLKGQMERIYNLMQDGQFRTLSLISNVTGDPESSVSAQLRNFRKARFGGFIVNRKRVDNTWYYQLQIGA